MSIGVATMVPLAGQPFFDLIHLADNLLYVAKRNGRDQVMTAIKAAVSAT